MQEVLPWIPGLTRNFLVKPRTSWLTQEILGESCEESFPNQIFAKKNVCFLVIFRQFLVFLAPFGLGVYIIKIKKLFLNVSTIYFAFYKGFKKPGSSWFVLRLSAWSYWFRSWFRSGTRYGEFWTSWFRSGTRFGEFWTSWFRSGTRKLTFVCSLLNGDPKGPTGSGKGYIHRLFTAPNNIKKVPWLSWMPLTI